MILQPDSIASKVVTAVRTISLFIILSMSVGWLRLWVNETYTGATLLQLARWNFF